MENTVPQTPLYESPDTSVLDFAICYAAAGISVVFIRPDGSKAPAYAWDKYKDRIATEDELRSLYRPGCGVAVIGGHVSGGLEILDSDEVAGKAFMTACGEAGLSALFHSLPLWRTPSFSEAGGGWQLCYRCPEFVNGNKKLARRSVELPNGVPNVITLMETRGDKGYAIVPPSPAECHPEHKPYVMLRGNLDHIPVLTADEKESLLSVARSFNEYAAPVKPIIARVHAEQQSENRPGDDYNERGDYETVLQDAGWRRTRTQGEKDCWQRPGKPSSDSSISATSNFSGSGLFHVFSSNAYPFESETAYSPFSVYTILKHGGDFSAASKALGASGYGKKSFPNSAPPAQPKKADAQSPQGKPESPVLPLKTPMLAGVEPVEVTVDNSVTNMLSDGENHGDRYNRTDSEIAAVAAEQRVNWIRNLPEAEVEDAALHCLLVSPSAQITALKLPLTADYFHHDTRPEAFACIMAILMQVGEVDRVSLRAECERRGLDSAGVETLYATEGRGAMFPAYLELLTQRMMARKGLEAFNAAFNLLSQANADPKKIIQDTALKLSEIQATAGEETLVHVRVAVTEMRTDYEYKRDNPQIINALPTGIKELDRVIGGLEPGVVYAGLARPSHGKSSLIAPIVSSVCDKYGREGLLFTPETTKIAVARRLAAIQAKVQVKKIKNPRDFPMLPEEEAKFFEANERIMAWPMYVDERVSPTLSYIQTVTRQRSEQGNLGVVILDYIQLMGEEGRHNTTASQVSYNMKGLAEMAKERKVAVLILCQIGRGVESRTDKRPTMADAKESGSIEEKADVIIGLYRESMYKTLAPGESIDPFQMEEAEFGILKNKDGERGIVKVGFIPAFSQFLDYSEVVTERWRTESGSDTGF